MLHAMLTLAAEEADKPSKVPFYVCGVLLVGWALVVATIGIRNEGFALEARRGRTLMAVSVVLALATMTAAVLTS